MPLLTFVLCWTYLWIWLQLFFFQTKRTNILNTIATPDPWFNILLIVYEILYWREWSEWLMIKRRWEAWTTVFVTQICKNIVCNEAKLKTDKALTCTQILPAFFRQLMIQVMW